MGASAREFAVAVAVAVAVAGWVAGGCATYGTGLDDNVDLTGAWTWVRSSGGIAGRTFTPATEHYTVQFNVENGRVVALRNDSVKATSNYVLAGDTVKYAAAIDVFLFDPQSDRQILRPAGADTIALADLCCDRWDHLFVRKR